MRFRFRLTEEEFDRLRSQSAISSERGGRRYLLTEQGVAMLSAMLRSDTAIEVSIGIIDEFVTMRRFLVENAALLERLRGIESGQAAFQRSADEHFDQAFRLLGVAATVYTSGN